MSTESTAAPAASSLAGLYRACGTIGNVGTPGAPISHYQLLVNPTSGTVSGIVYVTQAIPGPTADFTVEVKGTIRKTGFGSVQTLVQFGGEFTTFSPPPAIVVYKTPYTAHMVVDASWNGKGGFEYLTTRVENAPVKSEECQ